MEKLAISHVNALLKAPCFWRLNKILYAWKEGKFLNGCSKLSGKVIHPLKA